MTMVFHQLYTTNLYSIKKVYLKNLKFITTLQEQMNILNIRQTKIIKTKIKNNFKNIKKLKIKNQFNINLKQ